MCAVMACCVRAGSSPLARGLPHCLEFPVGYAGIIPARAGFTILDGNFLGTVWDHPRSRGVYVSSSRRRLLWRGSSPLARGLPSVDITNLPNLGIIPARAGFTWSRPRWWRSPRDHPRSRGVYSGWRSGYSPRRGSSPLARGLHMGRNLLASSAGIIPARAGFTRGGTRCRCSWGDHPRSRGVYSLRRVEVERRGGSSPLARGLRASERLAPDGDRIIPARAGFTDDDTTGSTKGRDHPRSRGVYPPAG